MCLELKMHNIKHNCQCSTPFSPLSTSFSAKDVSDGTPQDIWLKVIWLKVSRPQQVFIGPLAIQ